MFYFLRNPLQSDDTEPKTPTDPSLKISSFLELNIPRFLELKKKKENGGKSKSAKQVSSFFSLPKANRSVFLKIAKDMARWAKRVNDAKAVAKAAMAESDPPKMGIANSLGLQHIDEEETQVEEKGPSFFASEPSKPIDFSGMGPEGSEGN